MRIKFMKDFGEFREGQVIDLPENEADDHLQAGGRVVVYNLDEVPVEEKLAEEKPAKKAKK